MAIILNRIEKTALHSLGREFGDLRVCDIRKDLGKKDSFVKILFRLQSDMELEGLRGLFYGK